MQYDARQEVCSGLGEAPYDPDLHVRKFANADKIGGDVEPNPYWPLVVGTEWVYNAYDEEGELVEIITVYVTNDIKEIEYPEGSGQIFRCRVVTDLVTTPDGTLIEDTNDWYAQDKKGNVWYFGEIVVNYEDGEVTDVEGSWTSGVDGAKPGILMWANPGKKKGKMYRQEFFLGDAEDMALVQSKDEVEVEVPFGTYTKNVLQTEEWIPIEPEVTEFKYYAPGVGMVLEEGPDGETVELIKKAIVQVP